VDETYVLEVDRTGTFSAPSRGTDPRLVKEAVLTLGALYLLLREHPDFASTELSRGSYVGLAVARAVTWFQITDWLFGPTSGRRTRLGQWMAMIEQRVGDAEPWFEIIRSLAEELGVRPAWMWRLLDWTIQAPVDEGLASKEFRDRLRAYEQQQNVPVRSDYIIEIRLTDEESNGAEIHRLLYRRAEPRDFSDIVIYRRAELGGPSDTVVAVAEAKHSPGDSGQPESQTSFNDYSQMLRRFLQHRTGTPPEEVQRVLAPIQPRDTTSRSPAESEAYTLPSDLLAAYHRLVDKRFSEGLTPGEEMELREVSRKLDSAELSTPIERAIEAKSTHEHQKSLEVLNDVIAQLKSLQR
jgi:hypothetical protein